jgi:hypothetical protein
MRAYDFTPAFVAFASVSFASFTSPESALPSFATMPSSQSTVVELAAVLPLV